MQRILFLATAALLVMLSPCHGGFFDDLSRELLPSIQPQHALDADTVVKGLKEALATGTQRAVTEVAKPDGYYGNQLIKILLPERIRQTATILKEIGYRKEVDDLERSMNRAAESAAPQAAGFFGDSFKPTVTKSMNQVGTARAYKQLIGAYEALPLATLAGAPSLELDDYITNKALDGLFKMVGEEEKRIRSNPAAQTTELLRKVFGGK